MPTAADGPEVERLRARIVLLEEQNEQLRGALTTRILVEQAKGVLIERLDLPAEEVFELMRAASRRSRLKMQTLAAELLSSRTTPEYIMREVRHLQDPSV